MSINLLETVQQNLGYPPLQKIDPNTQAVVENIKTPDEDKFSQAAIPAVLTALYKYVQTDDGAAEILRGDNYPDWANKIFNNNTAEVIKTITTYTKKSGDAAPEELNEIAAEAVTVANKNLPPNADVKQVKLFFSGQRNNILLYLPSALQMGHLLDDDTLDDNTHKMEGPVSSLMHSIGAAFSTPVSDDELKK